jgi:hypothetical protein
MKAVVGMDLAIQPGRGVGSILFGCVCDEASEVLGQPDRIDETEDDMGERCIAWHYDVLGMSLYFDEDAEFRLGLVDASSLNISVHGIRPIGLSLDEAREAFKDHGGLTLDGEFAELGRCAYDLENEFVTLWFQDEVCDSIQAFVPIDFDDEYLWPTPSTA